MNEDVQNAFIIAQRLAELVATPGINEDTQKLANEYIQTVLKSVVKESITRLSASSKGLFL
jgi:hypothetical protein